MKAQQHNIANERKAFSIVKDGGRNDGDKSLYRRL